MTKMEKRPCNEPEVRKGPWTMEEDLILINYIANHGEGVWNSLARSAGTSIISSSSSSFFLLLSLQRGKSFVKNKVGKLYLGRKTYIDRF